MANVMNGQACLVLLILVSASQVYTTCRSGSRCLRDNCEMEQTEMNIVRDRRVTYENQERDVYCIGRVSVNKCDGSCVSSVRPSRVGHNALDKECKCCREINMSTREVTLNECYDGNQLLPGITESAQVTEPSGCSCQMCRN